MPKIQLKPEDDNDMDGIEVSPQERQAMSEVQLEREPKVTKLRGELRLGLIGVGALILVSMLFGIYYSGQKKAATPTQASGSVAGVKTAGNKDVTEAIDSMRLQAEKSRAEKGEAPLAGVDAGGGAISPNDPAASLNLPPAKVVQGTRANNVSVGGGRPAAVASHQMTEIEKVAWEEYGEEKKAMESGLGIKGGTGVALGSQAVSGAAKPTVADLLRTEMDQARAFGGGSPSQLPGSGANSDDQNKQNEKNQYLEGARSAHAESPGVVVSRIQTLSPYEIKAGWDIPATLDQAINSDLPGEMRGIVRENVYDSATGKFILIPQGSHVIGRYNSHVSYGQSAIQVVWTRLIYPDGSSIELGGLNGQDVRGLSGFRDKVDNHYARLIGDVLLSSAFSAGVEIGANGGTSSSTTTITPQQIATAALAQQLGEFGMEVARRDLNRQPTIKISIGYKFNIRVQKDLVFEAPYHDESARWQR